MDARSFQDSISVHKQFSAPLLLPFYWAISYLSSKIKIKSLPLGKDFLDFNRQSWLLCPPYSIALSLIMIQYELTHCAVNYLLRYLFLLLQCGILNGMVFIFVSSRCLICRCLITLIEWISENENKTTLMKWFSTVREEYICILPKYIQQFNI